LIKGLSPSIANKVELEPYLSFNDVFHLTIKIEKQLNGRKPIHSSLSKSLFYHNDLEIPPLQINGNDKGKGIVSELLTRLEGKKYFNAMVMDIFKRIVPIEEHSLLKWWRESKP